MNEDIVIPVAFFLTVIVLAIGVPLVLAVKRRWEQAPRPVSLSPELAARLDRLEQMVETVAVEVERMAEGQRFTTRLLSEGAAPSVAPAARSAVPAVQSETVTHA